MGSLLVWELRFCKATWYIHKQNSKRGQCQRTRTCCTCSLLKIPGRTGPSLPLLCYSEGSVLSRTRPDQHLAVTGHLPGCRGCPQGDQQHPAAGQLCLSGWWLNPTTQPSHYPGLHPFPAVHRDSKRPFLSRAKPLLPSKEVKTE